MNTRVFICLILFICHNAWSELYTPADNDIIAKAQSVNSATLSQDQLMVLLLNSQYIGQTELRQGLLKNQLRQLYAQSPTAQIGYMYARVLQREHQFDLALSITAAVLKNDPNHVNTHLLRANMLMVQGEFFAAKRQCLKLLGLTAMDVVSTCTLDVLSQTEQLAASYQSLKNSILPAQRSNTTRHLLAEMALRLAKPEAALAHIQNLTLSNAPVSLIVLWADINLALGDDQIILNTIPALLEDSQNLEDALLLRLAIAERNSKNKTQLKWQNLMAKRVALRELRQDTFHASDLAYYYLALNKQPEKALHWALINWQQAKLDADRTLLAKAKLANQAQEASL